ncbi:MAG: SDR family NAD(P)-dependent oxidoreductase [Patescibacteria group bacterium]|nr:SDR family NAD(P)-dependent oxidoreductase [Patescibacteria group bacterium]
MKTILITGASSGIGLACARKLQKDNRLVLCSRNLDKLHVVKKDLKASDKEMMVFGVDVTNSEQVKKMFNTLDKQKIYPDVLINSAGLALGLANFEDSLISDFDTMVNTNIKGLLYVTKFALKYMKRENRGHIINMGSIAGINTYAKGIVYAATKAAVKSISDGLRKDVIEHKIRITNIQPGLVETNFSITRFGGDKEKAKEAYFGIKPLSAEDIATIIKFSIESPEHVQINEITVTPLHQATVENIYRDNK